MLEVLNKTKKGNTDRLPPCISPLQTEVDVPQYGGAAPLINLFWGQQDYVLQKIDLLKVCLNKDEAMCSLQLQGN